MEEIREKHENENMDFSNENRAGVGMSSIAGAEFFYMWLSVSGMYEVYWDIYRLYDSLIGL